MQVLASQAARRPPCTALLCRSQVHDPKLLCLVGAGQYYSMTYRLFKVPGRIETLCQDYGQAARYKARQTAAYRRACQRAPPAGPRL
jgi:hypothetical protein